ncbi:hypothetical protein [Streptomyces sp. enrichment culture]|uniref:hypothetical protein n=1 Tax=Streptomyces sp. enrichment culture TaxID=1795815 RepID=UPI003F57B432
MDLHIDVRWLLDRQEEPLGEELAVRDYSGLVAAVARHRVNTPSIEAVRSRAHRRRPGTRSSGSTASLTCRSEG